MRKIFACSALFCFFAFSLSAATRPLIASKDVDLSGITEIAFELGPPSIAFGFSTATHDYTVSGGGRADKLSLSLEGDIFASRDSARPRLLTERDGSKLVVRLYEKGTFFFFVTQGGSAHFLASIPDGFAGRVSVLSSSGKITLSGLNPSDLAVRSSSGSIAGSALAPGEADISASSGSIEIDTLSSTGRVSVEASSGSIRVEKLSGSDLKIGSSSGGVEIGDFAGNLVCGVSSGSIRLASTKLSGSIDIDSSSGSVTLELPSDSAFSAKLETSSGSIRSDFTLVGDVSKQEKDRLTGDANGGGHSVKIGVSSGSIKLLAR